MNTEIKEESDINTSDQPSQNLPAESQLLGNTNESPTENCEIKEENLRNTVDQISQDLPVETQIQGNPNENHSDKCETSNGSEKAPQQEMSKNALKRLKRKEQWEQTKKEKRFFILRQLSI